MTPNIKIGVFLTGRPGLVRIRSPVLGVYDGALGHGFSCGVVDRLGIISYRLI
jgi:hypothetical protein